MAMSSEFSTKFASPILQKWDIKSGQLPVPALRLRLPALHRRPGRQLHRLPGLNRSG
jgi:hypothetical protein